ncbi:MAG: hypothetical protein AAF438_03525 [Pseudomonadota bacterium]
MTVLAVLNETQDDATAECRWWNDLLPDQRQALLLGARRSLDCVNVDWLDIGETNRKKILEAAFAIQCWLREVSPSHL